MAVATRLAVAASDRAQLTTWVARPRRGGVWRAAAIILLSAEGLSAAAIADRLGIVRLTVYKWRQRYVRHGLGGLPRSARRAAAHLSPRAGARHLALDGRADSHEATHWSLRLMPSTPG